MANITLKEKDVTVEDLLAGAKKSENWRNKKHKKQRKMRRFHKMW